MIVLTESVKELVASERFIPHRFWDLYYKLEMEGRFELCMSLIKLTECKEKFYRVCSLYFAVHTAGMAEYEGELDKEIVRCGVDSKALKKFMGDL